jgi:hypothetical protein
MKRIIHQVYVGKRSKLYDHCTASVKAYAAEHGIDYVLQDTPELFIRPDPFATNRSKEAVDRLGYLPIFEKETAFEHLYTHDQVAVIDSDIYIRPGSPNLFDVVPTECDFAAVAEREMPITRAYQDKIRNYSTMQYANLQRDANFKPNQSMGYEFFNMGLMVMNKSLQRYLKGQSPREFLRRPEFKVFVDGVGTWKWSTDQTLLNYWLKKDNIRVHHLDWRFNGLFTANTRIEECHFVHFFLKDKLPNGGEDINELMKQL